MTWRRCSIALALLTLGAFASGRAVSQEMGRQEEDRKRGEYGQEKPGRPELDPKQKEMMDAWMKHATPGPHHKHLEPLVGRWTTANKFWFGTDPAAPPQESRGTVERKWILGGRFLLEEVIGECGPDEPAFEGHGILGYDNMKKQYTAAWADTMSTGIMTLTGTCDASAKKFTFTGEFDDPATNTRKAYRHVLTIESPSRHTLEFFEREPARDERRTGHIVFTRS